jgi:hypothetical protein
MSSSRFRGENAVLPFAGLRARENWAGCLGSVWLHCVCILATDGPHRYSPEETGWIFLFRRRSSTGFSSGVNEPLYQNVILATSCKTRGPPGAPAAAEVTDPNPVTFTSCPAALYGVALFASVG